MWALSSQTRDWTCAPCIGSAEFNHWTAREVPPHNFINYFYLDQVCCLEFQFAMTIVSFLISHLLEVHLKNSAIIADIKGISFFKTNPIYFFMSLLSWVDIVPGAFSLPYLLFSLPSLPFLPFFSLVPLRDIDKDIDCLYQQSFLHSLILKCVQKNYRNLYSSLLISSCDTWMG